MTKTLTENAANYWAGATLDAMPATVVHAAKRHMLDTVAAVIAGSQTPVARDLLTALHRGAGAGGSCSLWGRAEMLPPATAALWNGSAAHALEIDDFGGCGHSGAVVVPAVLAASALRPASGADILLAVIAGYDIASRVLEAAGGYAVHNQRGWHSTATCGTFGAAAGAARILGLDPERYADALGVAGTYVGGIWAFMADGAMTKRLHGGKAAETGVSAALMAQSGISGPRQILEAPWGGFLSCYASESRNDAAFLKGLGEDFHILRSGLKPYPVCRGVHSVLDCLFEAMNSRPFTADDVAQFVVQGEAHTPRQFGNRQIRSLFDAQFSIPFCLAIAAVDGKITLAGLDPERANEERIRSLMDATEIRTERNLGQIGHPGLEIGLRDQTRIVLEAPFPKGAPQNPLSDAELTKKVEDLLVPVLGSSQSAALIEMIWHLDAEKSLVLITALLHGHSR